MIELDMSACCLANLGAGKDRAGGAAFSSKRIRALDVFDKLREGCLSKIMVPVKLSVYGLVYSSTAVTVSRGKSTFGESTYRDIGGLAKCQPKRLTAPHPMSQYRAQGEGGDQRRAHVASRICVFFRL